MFVLNRLWRGDLSPSQRTVRKDSEYEKVLSRLCRIGEELSGGMTEEERKIFDKFQLTQAELSSIENEEIFIDGFRMGCQMMLDAFGDYQGQI